ncbi:hypothetical protein SKAU_G00249570 [Synaphobranchus kaupii]|uniref:Uncharacterized protein n=1 Tax=Synaphobranchus kaupii TaxID=118154 RepID=A0A9Q1F2J6_SYNKA|nr:hypothetical protein SKAU_G00249570 [Synaphobranchus kaupii]
MVLGGEGRCTWESARDQNRSNSRSQLCCLQVGQVQALTETPSCLTDKRKGKSSAQQHPLVAVEGKRSPECSVRSLCDVTGTAATALACVSALRLDVLLGQKPITFAQIVAVRG